MKSKQQIDIFIYFADVLNKPKSTQISLISF